MTCRSSCIWDAMGKVHTTTCRAFTAAEMDKIVAKVHGAE